MPLSTGGERPPDAPVRPVVEMGVVVVAFDGGRSLRRGGPLVNDFRMSDVLFDFFIPADPGRIRREDLFQRVYLPGLGFI